MMPQAPARTLHSDQCPFESHRSTAPLATKTVPQRHLLENQGDVKTPVTPMLHDVSQPAPQTPTCGLPAAVGAQVCPEDAVIDVTTAVELQRRLKRDLGCDIT